jgi:hypothetical protein
MRQDLPDAVHDFHLLRQGRKKASRHERCNDALRWLFQRSTAEIEAALLSPLPCLGELLAPAEPDATMLPQTDKEARM